MLFVLALLAFVSLGLPDALLGVAWPGLRRELGQPLDAMGLVLAATVGGYLVSSSASGAASRRLGVGSLLVSSGALVVLGNLAIALAPSLAAVLAGALVSGLGGGAIDAVINAHAAHHFVPGRVVWLHACWGIGAALGAGTMAWCVAGGAGWRVGYGAVAVVVALLSAGFLLTRGRWHRSAEGQARAAALASSLREPRVRRHGVLFFLYTGLEAGLGQWAFKLLTEQRSYPVELAGAAVSGYWGSLTAGRLVGGVVAHHVAPARMVLLALVLAPLGSLMFAAGPGGGWPLVALCALGFSFGPVFPLLIAQTPARVGPAHASNAVGFQVAAAALGSAAVPGVAGVLGRHLGLSAIGAWLVLVAAGVLFAELRVRQRAGRAGEHAPGSS